MKSDPKVDPMYNDATLQTSAMEKVQTYLDLVQDPDYNCYDGLPLRGVKLLNATDDGRVDFELTVAPDMCNYGGTMHGGCAATIMDNLTSMSAFVVAKPGYLDAGTVSRTLTCTYIRALRAGETVTITCDILGGGKSLCHVRGEMRTADGRVAISCVHDKASKQKSRSKL